MARKEWQRKQRNCLELHWMSLAILLSEVEDFEDYLLQEEEI
jgi:hypothetical protein